MTAIQNYGLRKGNTFRAEWSFGFLDENGAEQPTDLRGLEAVLYLRWNGGNLKKSSNVEGSGLTVSGANGEILTAFLSIADVDPIPVGDIEYEVELVGEVDQETKVAGIIKMVKGINDD